MSPFLLTVFLFRQSGYTRPRVQQLAVVRWTPLKTQRGVFNSPLVERGVTRVSTATCRTGGLAGATTTPALLRLLGVDHEPVTRPADAIRVWLADNVPSPQLIVSLLSNGYGLLLKVGSRRSA